jgi:hypothetical protein
MLSHSIEHEVWCVCVHEVVSLMLQLALHMVLVCSAQLCSTEVVAQVVWQSCVGLNSHWELAVRNMPPQASSSFACAALGKTDNPNSNADADNVVIRTLMIRLPRLDKSGANESHSRTSALAACVPPDRIFDLARRTKQPSAESNVETLCC